MKVAADPLSRKKIRELATMIREMCGLKTTCYFPIVEFIEHFISAGDEGLSFVIVSEDEMEDMYGTTDTSSDIMKIREDVYIGAINGNPRDRFTLCHELGHFLLHRPGRISFARGEIPKYQDPEWQANTFAGELMAPYYLVRGMSVKQIAEKCGMSLTAAGIQHSMYQRCSREYPFT